MQRRDFGPQNHNHAPVNGYNHIPHFYSERGNRPIPGSQSYYQRRSNLLLPQIELETSLDIINETPEAVSSPELGNQELPIFARKAEIVDAVQNNPVAIVVSETGGGKSTQIPQFLFEAGFDVQITQPRRMATYGVAERIQEELKPVFGNDAYELVGYQTAEKSTVSNDTKVTVLTDGIEHARQFNQLESRGNLVTIIDEVHEWNENTEITIAMIKRRIQTHPEERYVLASATMDAHKLANYFAEVTETIPPVIEVEGRAHNIEAYEKEHSTIVDEVIESVTTNPESDILVFVPGKPEIQETIDAILSHLPPSLKQRAVVLPLHAKMLKHEQDRVYKKYGGPKIIVSTNVAQTSLTIDGIDVVIDSGIEKRQELDDEEVLGLHIEPISQADCDQRKGRTGRTAPGKYILTRYDADTEHVPYISRPRYSKAAILRGPLDRTVLRTRANDIDLANLDPFHPVKKQSILRAEESLFNLGALDDENNITRLGITMDHFPVGTASARMICESLQFSPRVRSYVAAITASTEVGGLPYFARNSGKAWQRLTEETTSDYLAQLDIFIAAQDMSDTELQENDLDVQNITRARQLYRKIVHRTDAHIGPMIPPTLAEKEQIAVAVGAGMVDSVYVHIGNGQYELVSQAKEATQERELSNRSVLRGQEPHLVFGNPYRVVFKKRGIEDTRHILERVAVIEDPALLGKVAIEALLTDKVDRITWSAGKLMQVSRKMFNGIIDVGIESVAPAKNTPETRALVRKHIMDKPGTAQKQLRGIKKEIEQLRHFTEKTSLVKDLTQQELEGYVDRALKDGVFDEDYVDGKLWEIITSEKISIDTYVTPENRRKIIAAAPEVIEANGYELGLEYRNGQPRVKNNSCADILELPNEIKLADNRDVRFWYNRRWVTIDRLKQLMYQEVMA